MSSSVEREDEGRGVTGFFSVGRLHDSEVDKREHGGICDMTVVRESINLIFPNQNTCSGWTLCSGIQLVYILQIDFTVFYMSFVCVFPI